MLRSPSLSRSAVGRDDRWCRRRLAPHHLCHGGCRGRHAAAALTAADLVVSEGDQARPVIRVEPSRATLRVAIAVEERLAPDNDVRRSVANFIDQIRDIRRARAYTCRPPNRTARRLHVGDPPLRQRDQRVPRPRRRSGRSRAGAAGNRARPASARGAARHRRRGDEGGAGEQRHGRRRAGTAQGRVAPCSTRQRWPDRRRRPFRSGATSGGRRLDLEGQVSGLERDKVFGDGTRQSGGLHLSSPADGRHVDGPRAHRRRAAQSVRRVVRGGSAKSDGSVSVTAGRAGIAVRGPTRHDVAVSSQLSALEDF